MAKAFELKELELDEISLVDRGANMGAKVVLMKRDVSKMIKEENGKFCVYSMDGKKLGEHDTREEAMAQLKAVEANSQAKKCADGLEVAERDGAWAVIDGDSIVAKSDTEDGAIAQVALAKAVQTESVSTRVYKTKVDSLGVLIRAGFEPSAACKVVGLPSIPHTGLVPITVKEEEEFSSTNTSMFGKWLSELGKAGKKISSARMAKLNEAYRALFDIMSEQEQEGKGEASNMDTSKLSKAEQDYIKELEAKAAQADAVAKKATEDAVAKAHADAKAEIEKAKKDAEEAKAEVAKERDARLNKEYEGKVSVFKRLSIKADDAKVFRAIDEKLPEELAKRLWEIVKGANEAMASAAIMTKQIGSGEGDNGSDDPVSNVETLMKAELAKNDKLSEGKAMAEVFAKNPGLYEAYREATAVRV